MKSKLALLVCSLFLISCSSIHSVELTDLNNGQLLSGEYDESEQIAKVRMPDGEILKGHYTLNKDSNMTFGRITGMSSTYDSSGISNTFSSGSVVTASSIYSRGQAYGILTGKKGTVMEILVDFTGSSGFGKAVTNKGHRYGVQF